MARSKPARLPSRKSDSHKGDYGKILVVAGSLGMAGAAVLVSKGAYRSGAGLVTIATPDSLVPTVAALQVCAIVRGLPDSRGALGPGAADEVLAQISGMDVLAMGPGLGLNASSGEEIRQIVRHCTCPMVLDADALNAFADHPDLLDRGSAPRVYTPHVGEMARLTHQTIEAIQKNRVKAAEEAAKRFRGVLLLKGPSTVITDGQRTVINTTGNPGMATGGSGDVLTGIIAALLGQGLDPFDAARLGAHLHGLAGDIAAKELGMISMMATDILDHLPAAFKKHQGGKS